MHNASMLVIFPSVTQMAMIAAMQAKSRQLCQDQLAWFRDDPLFYWVDATRSPADLAQSILESINSDFHQGELLYVKGCVPITRSIGT